MMNVCSHVWTIVFRMGDDEENDEPDHETFVSQAMYELRSGSADIALEYLNNALKLEQDDENIYIMRYH